MIDALGDFGREAPSKHLKRQAYFESLSRRICRSLSIIPLYRECERSEKRGLYAFSTFLAKKYDDFYTYQQTDDIAFTRIMANYLATDQREFS